MTKASFSHKIDDSFLDCFEKMYEKLGPPKFRILEAAIEVFDALPWGTKNMLKSWNHDEREPILAQLGKIRPHSADTDQSGSDADALVDKCIEEIKEYAVRYKIPGKEEQRLIANIRAALSAEAARPQSVGEAVDALEDAAASQRGRAAAKAKGHEGGRRPA